MPGRLVLLTSSRRVAPGLLSWAGWSTLQAADEVYAGAADHPLSEVLSAAGVRVTVRAAEPVAGLADFLSGRAEEASVVWLAAPEGDAEVAGLAVLLGAGTRADRAGSPVELVAGSWDLPGARLLDLVAVMDRLRSPGGCPWDAGQTHESLLPYLIEETYETVEAVETADLVGLREELGDLLLQVVFHARVAQEHDGDPWSIDDVADGIVAKLVSRHPHVFAGAPAGDADELEQSWEELKRAEKQRTSAVDGVPLAQPALALAAKLIARANRSGVPLVLPDPLGPVSLAASHPAAGETPDEAVGAVLLALVAQAQAAGVDPEAALRAAARSFAAQVRAAEAGAPRVGVLEAGASQVGSGHGAAERVAGVDAPGAPTAGEIASAP